MMQVILLEKVQNLGQLGDTVRVKPGYARNFLIPQGKAVPATPDYVAEFEAKRAELERQEAEVLAAAQARAAMVEGKEVVIARKAGEEGRLFGSVGNADVAEALAALGVEIERNEIRLHGDTIRQLGDHPVGIHLHTDVEVEITVHVVAEGSTDQ